MPRASPTLAAALIAVAIAGCGAGSRDRSGGPRPEHPVVLTMANALQGPADIGQFADAVARISHGSLRIHIINDWRHGDPRFERRLVGDVRAGDADLGWVGSRIWSSLGVAGFDALDAPLLIDNYPLEQAVVRDASTEALLDGLRPLGLRGIGLLPGPLRRLAGARDALLSPANVRGLRVGIQESRVAEDAVAALGGRAVLLAAGRGAPRLEAAEQQLPSLSGNPPYRGLVHVTTDVILWPRAAVLFAGPRALARLTEQQVRVLRAASAGAIAPITADTRASDDEAAHDLCARGAALQTAGPEGLAGFRRALRPVYARLADDPATAAELRAITALKQHLAVPAGAPTCGSPAAVGPAGRPTPVDGLYRMNLTARRLAAAGALASDIVPENWGDYRVALSRGRFALTQENDDACTWAAGRFAVRGDLLVLRFRPRGGGQAPTGAINYPTDPIRFHWSRYHDLLQLRGFGGEVARVTFVEPLRRIGDHGSRDGLSRRCLPPADVLGR